MEVSDMRYRAKSKELKSQRILCGITQGEMAQLLGTYQSSVSGFEIGKVTVSKDKAIEIACLLKTDLNRIFEPFCSICGRPINN